MKCILYLGIFASFLEGIVCPSHHSSAVSCFHCRGWGDVPTCLHAKHTCHHDEVCEIVWGTHDVTIGCRKEHDCLHDTYHTSTTCPGGAHHTYKGCEKCCTDSSCVDGFATVLRKIDSTTTTAHPPRPAHAPFSCPVLCVGQKCSNYVHHCSSHEFCEIRAEHARMSGHCVSSHEIYRCFAETVHNDAMCRQNNLDLIHGSRKCHHCCENQLCAMSHYRPTTTQKPTTETSHMVNIVVTTPRPTTTSTTTTTTTTTTARPTHPPFTCPASCVGQTCSNFVHHCSSNEFCELRAEHGIMTGRCLSGTEFNRCFAETTHNDNACKLNVLSYIHDSMKCLYCCEHDTCTKRHFRPTTTQKTTTETSHMVNIIFTTPRPTTKSKTTTTKTTLPTTATTATTTVTTTKRPNPLVNGDCKNLLELNGCDTVNTTVCSTDLGVRVCADSCGLCSLIKSRFTNNIICADHLISNECQVLQKTQNICNQNIAMFTCPKSCNICESVLDHLIKEVLTKTTTFKSTSTAKTTMTSTQRSTSSSPQTSTTSSTQTSTTSSTQTSTTSSPQTSPSSSTTQAASTATSGAATTPSSAPSSSKPVTIIHMTQVISQQPQVTNSTCIDTLQGMNCVDLTDICKNSLGPRVCKKFCGLCGSTPVSTVPVMSSPTP